MVRLRTEQHFGFKNTEKIGRIFKTNQTFLQHLLWLAWIHQRNLARRTERSFHMGSCLLHRKVDWLGQSALCGPVHQPPGIIVTLR